MPKATHSSSNHDTTQLSSAIVEPKQAALRHNDKGEEILDPIPMQPPLGYKKTISLAEQIRQQVRLHQLELDNAAIEETEEEADDFDVGEDYEPLSKYENDHIPSVKELKKKAAAINEAIRAANNKKAIEEHEAKKASQKEAPPAPPTEPALPATPRTET